MISGAANKTAVNALYSPRDVSSCVPQIFAQQINSLVDLSPPCENESKVIVICTSLRLCFTKPSSSRLSSPKTIDIGCITRLHSSLPRLRTIVNVKIHPSCAYCAQTLHLTSDLALHLHLQYTHLGRDNLAETVRQEPSQSSLLL